MPTLPKTTQYPYQLQNVDTFNDLRGVKPNFNYNQTIIVCEQTSNGDGYVGQYLFVFESVAADDNYITIKPDSVSASDPGRWIRFGYNSGGGGGGSNPIGPAGGDLDGSYPNPDIRANVIVNADINSNADISLSKLQDISTDTLLGRDTAGSGSIEELSINNTLTLSSLTLGRAAISGDATIAAGSNTATVTDLTISGESQGSTLYFNGSNWVRLAPGTSGFVLQTNGVGANPTWVSPAAASLPAVNLFGDFLNSIDGLTYTSHRFLVDSLTGLIMIDSLTGVPIMDTL